MKGISVRKEKKDHSGEFTRFRGEDYYKITHYDRMVPFFINLVSEGNHWLFISTTGGLTAGRVNADRALFPYYTEDKVASGAEETGSKTILLVEDDGELFLWEPFSIRYRGIYAVTRNLYKNLLGNKLLFEEINRDLGLVFQYAWENSALYGIVKESRVINQGKEKRKIRFLDGVQNLLPPGITSQTQNEFSCLIDGYKKNELDRETGLGIFRMSSLLTDKTEPAESLLAATAWGVGIEADHILLTSCQLDRFREGEVLETEVDQRGRRGAYFLEKELFLAPGEEREWFIALDTGLDHGAVAELRHELRSPVRLLDKLKEDIRAGGENLRTLVGKADGLQLTGNRMDGVHHYANTLFNIMRGGLFESGYEVEIRDFLNFVGVRNRRVYAALERGLEGKPEIVNYFELEEWVKAQGRGDEIRLFYEYLPLSFSRRHGDPSRPWNIFSINITGEKGERLKYYQGNWRDIFQNWEALGLSFPGYLKGMTAKFFNALTAEGYNPYRVTTEGIEWEKPEPGNPWSNIGYWGDHQIIYILKLLEWGERFFPRALEEFAGASFFSCSRVPYRIKDYEDILTNNRDTIEFDFALDNIIEEKVKEMGSDGRLITLPSGEVYLVNLTEKVLILTLAKLANFVPGGGIWMSTQRPEWNDANNALAGPGLSVVTLAYLRRFAAFFCNFYASREEVVYSISKEVLGFLERIRFTFQELPLRELEGRERKDFMDRLGHIATEYRKRIYAHGFSGEKDEIRGREIFRFFELVLSHLDHSLASNRRSDGLYHSYNLLDLETVDQARIIRLYEMLEGQVAVLSSGLLSAGEVSELLDALRSSRLYREDQDSYLLYPDKKLPSFLEKNSFSRELVAGLESVKMFTHAGDRRVMYMDRDGVFHFNPVLRNALVLKEKLEEMENEPLYASILPGEKEKLLELYEKLFHHLAFTGRSGTFFAYEGLGSIYWHMVSKLLLAVQENCLKEPGNKRLIQQYRAIRKGLGFNKTPGEYGAFPPDPYSHTPGHTGARQPGMTGQVKEEILTRLTEMGVKVEKGKVYFEPFMLAAGDFCGEEQVFAYTDVRGEKQEITLVPGELVFTFCQVPVVYTSGCAERNIRLLISGSTRELGGSFLPEEESLSLFRREGKISRIMVSLNIK